MHPSTGLEIRRLGWHRPSAGTKRVASQTLQMLWLTSQRSKGTVRTAAVPPLHDSKSVLTFLPQTDTDCTLTAMHMQHLGCHGVKTRAAISQRNVGGRLGG
jgi:hypothetical protein